MRGVWNIESIILKKCTWNYNSNNKKNKIRRTFLLIQLRNKKEHKFKSKESMQGSTFPPKKNVKISSWDIFSW